MYQYKQSLGFHQESYIMSFHLFFTSKIVFISHLFLYTCKHLASVSSHWRFILDVKSRKNSKIDIKDNYPFYALLYQFIHLLYY